MIVEHHRRGVRVKALPIGIPYDRFELLSKTAPKVFSNDGVKVLALLAFGIFGALFCPCLLPHIT